MQSSCAIKTLNNRVVTPPLSHLDKLRFLVAICFALLFIAQPSNAQGVDASQPTIAFTNPSQLVNDAAFTLTGTVTASATVNVVLAGGSSMAATVTGTDWSLDVMLTDGNNVFTATATVTDAGSTSTATATVTITLNRDLAEAPAITAINTVLNRASDEGVICITFDEDVKFGDIHNNSFLDERLDDFVLSVLSGGASPAPTVINFAGHCSGRNVIKLILNRQIAFGETATLSYTKTGTKHDTRGIRKAIVGGSEPLANFSNEPITNNAIAPIEGLALQSAGTFSAANQSAANQIFLAFGENITTSPDLRVADFAVSGAASSPTVTGIDGSLGPTVLLLTLSKKIVADETITLSYTKTTGSITGATEGVLANFDNYSVTNTVAHVATTVSKAETNSAGTAIMLTFNREVIIEGGGRALASKFTVTADDVGVDVTNVTVDGKVLTLALSRSVSTTDIRVNYDRDRGDRLIFAQIRGKTGGLVSAFNNKPAPVKPGLTPESAKQLNENILPRLTHVMLGSTVSAVNSRMDDTFSGTPQVASYQFDGQMVELDSQTRLSANLQNTVEQKLPSYIKSLKDDAMDWKTMLSRSSFVMPLNAVDGVAAGTGATVWGSGDYSNLSGKVGDGDWKGDVLSLQLGIDQRLRNDLLVGGLVSWSKGDVDYTLNGERGNYTHQITSVHPYFAHSSGDADLWGSVGYGQGKRTIKQQGATNELSNDTRLLSLSAGFSRQLTQSGQSGWKLKSDLALARTTIVGSADIPADKLSSQRLRLLLEIDKERPLASGGRFKPLVEVGLRYGDSSGIGAVLGFGGRYVNTTGLTIQGKLHASVGQDDYKEWGVQGTIRQQANANGQGLSFSLSPGYGTTGKSANQIWEQKLPDGNSNRDNSARLDVNMGYGLSVAGGNGLLTPYSEATFGESDSYLLGIKWQRNSRFSLKLFGKRANATKNYTLGANWKRPRYDMSLSAGREEGNSGTVKHGVLLESRIRF